MGIVKFSDLFIQGQFALFEYLRLRIHGINYDQYYQVKSTVNDLLNRKLLRIKLTKCEQALYSGGIFRKTV